MSGQATQPAGALLRLTAVSRRFGGLKVLQEVTLAIPRGGIFGLIGPNGAGKTTVFNLVTGLLAPSGGAIEFDGRPLAGLAPHRITRLGIARTFQNIRLFREMSLLDNVVVGLHARLGYGSADLLAGTARFRRAERQARERAHELLAWLRLDHKLGERADNLSYGEQRRLELARALATEPKLLLLDEPVAGMNSAEKTLLMDDVRRIGARGCTVFMIEHDMRFVMALCEDIAVLNFGRIIARGGPDAIRSDAQVIEAYLGRDDEPAPAPPPR